MFVSEIKTGYGFKEFVRSNSNLIVVDFYANWCQPCKAMSKVLEDVAQQTPSVKYVKVNVDTLPLVATEYVVSSLPTLVLLKRGLEVGRLVGLESKEKVLAFVKKHM